MRPRLLLAVITWAMLVGTAEAAPSFDAEAAVTFTFTAASNSAARIVQTADAIFLATQHYDHTGDTIASTIAGASPTQSYQSTNAEPEGNYLAVYVGAPSGSQTVAITGGDTGDDWSAGFRGLNGGHATTPFNNQVTDIASAASISVTTTADGLAVGATMAESNAAATSDTQVFEGPETGSFGFVVNVASTAGTGGVVSIDWTSETFYASIAVNMLIAAGGAPAATPTRTLLGVGQ